MQIYQTSVNLRLPSCFLNRSLLSWTLDSQDRLATRWRHRAQTCDPTPNEYVNLRSIANMWLFYIASFSFDGYYMYNVLIVEIEMVLRSSMVC